MTTRVKKRRIHQAPIAVASDGSVLVNAARMAIRNDITDIISEARKQAGKIFIGVTLDTHEAKTLLRDVDDFAAEIAARIGGRRYAGKDPTMKTSGAKSMKVSGRSNRGSLEGVGGTIAIFGASRSLCALKFNAPFPGQWVRGNR
jgi:hypothetical protein